MHMLGVHSKWVHPLPMNVATEIPDTGGVRVTLIEANHCTYLLDISAAGERLIHISGPGSSLFLYEGKQTVNAGDSTFKSAYVGSSKVFRYLHCGDFRASPQHVLHPAIKGKRIDHVYLDTTYLDPKVRHFVKLTRVVLKLFRSTPFRHKARSSLRVQSSRGGSSLANPYTGMRGVIERRTAE